MFNNNENNIIKIAVIGTAGRDESKPLTKNHFKFMCNTLITFIKENNLTQKNILLVSGGSAWSDHVAVDTFLKFSDKLKLLLYLPCPIVEIEDNNNHNDSSIKNYQFFDSGKTDWSQNPGRVTNFYHEKFSKVMERNTINDIIIAKDKGAILNTSSHGFQARNVKVSQSDIVIAFSFGINQPEAPSGTYDTFTQASTKQKYHFSLLNIS